MSIVTPPPPNTHTIDDIIKTLTAQIESIDILRSNPSNHMVEKYDYREVKESLVELIENLIEIKEYQSYSGTNYDLLWESRKEDAKAIREAQTNWIRTELFKILLN